MAGRIDYAFSTTVLESDYTKGKDVDRLELEASRRALQLLKRKLGPKRLHELLIEEIEDTDRRWEAWAAESNGKWRRNESMVEVKGLDLTYWLQWFRGHLDDESMHFSVHPEHYVWTLASHIHDEPAPGEYMVVEPMGDDLLRGYARVVEWDGFEDFFDTDFPMRMGIAGYTRNGVMIARSIAQYRETTEGFVTKFIAMKPEAVPPAMLGPNQEHGRLEYHRYMERAREARLREESRSA